MARNLEMTEEPLREAGSEADEVGKQLKRIFASKAFRQADRLKRFLNFVVTETVAGRAEGLKEFSIGVEVFGRDPSFDPRFDPIVRVQARRLRAQMDRYYNEEAGPGEIVLEVPKGRYAVVFKPPEAAKAAPANGQSVPLLVSRNTVVVLPFADLSPKSDQAYFCAGLTEEVVHTLTATEGVRVVSPGGQSAGAVALDPADAAARFHAAVVIGGSVRRSSDFFRITANLIDTTNASYLASISVDRLPEDIFTVQEEIARMIAERLMTEIADDGRHKGGPPARNLAAYNFYVQGRYHQNQRTEEGLRKAVEFFEKAVAEDGQYANAYSGLADAYGLLGHYGALSPAEVWTKTVSNAAWAVLCDDNSAEAHTSMAHTKSTQDWDWAGAESEFRRAIQLDPRYPTAHHWYAVSLLAPTGRMEEARREMRLAQALDPISPIIARDLARISYYMGDYEAALDQCDQTIDLDPHFAPAYALLGFLQVRRGEFDESCAAFQHAIQLSPTSPSLQAALGYVLARFGRREEAMEILGKVVELSAKRYVSPFDVALLHIALGNIDEGIAWIQKAFQDRCFELVLLKVDPRLDSIKPDPRFIELVKKVRLP